MITEWWYECKTRSRFEMKEASLGDVAPKKTNDCWRWVMRDGETEKRRPWRDNSCRLCWRMGFADSRGEYSIYVCKSILQILLSLSHLWASCRRLCQVSISEASLTLSMLALLCSVLSAHPEMTVHRGYGVFIFCYLIFSTWGPAFLFVGLTEEPLSFWSPIFVGKMGVKMCK